MEDPSTGGMSDVVSGPAGKVIVGSVCVSTGDCEPAIWRTTGGLDGGPWERATLPEADVPGHAGVAGPDASRAHRRLSGRLTSVASHPGLGYVAVGPGMVLLSSDGRTWTLSRQTPAGDLQQVTRIGDQFLVTVASTPNTAWSSADGMAWTPVEPRDGGPVDAQGGVTDSRVAADDVTAVWLGTAVDGGDLVAWVSVGK
jgi:hypothetical protein